MELCFEFTFFWYDLDFCDGIENGNKLCLVSYLKIPFRVLLYTRL